MVIVPIQSMLNNSIAGSVQEVGLVRNSMRDGSNPQPVSPFDFFLHSLSLELVVMEDLLQLSVEFLLASDLIPQLLHLLILHSQSLYTSKNGEKNMSVLRKSLKTLFNIVEDRFNLLFNFESVLYNDVQMD